MCTTSIKYASSSFSLQNSNILIAEQMMMSPNIPFWISITTTMTMEKNQIANIRFFSPKEWIPLFKIVKKIILGKPRCALFDRHTVGLGVGCEA